MPKVGKILTKEQTEVAEKNGLSLVTVYARIKRGWGVERAITEPSKSMPHLKEMHRNEGGELISDSGAPKGKIRSFRLPEELDEMADRAIAESGKTQSDWAADIVAQYLLKPKEKRLRKKS